MDERDIPPGDFLIERDGLGPGRRLLKRAAGDTDIVDGDLRVLATIRFDVALETLALFVHEPPRSAGDAHRRGRRLAAGATPDELLAAFLEEPATAVA